MPGNGFTNGGPGTLTRAGTIPKQKTKEEQEKELNTLTGVLNETRPVKRRRYCK